MNLKIFQPSEAKQYITEKIKSLDDENIVPYASDPFSLISGIVEDNEEFVALGVCKVVNEFKVVTNPGAGKLKITAAINELISEAMLHCKQRGANEIFAVLTKGGNAYRNFLVKRHNFELINGIALKREV